MIDEQKRINAGYEIIKELKIGNVEFVVGQNIANKDNYVTWEYTPTGQYYWGHYMSDRDATVRDMYERAEAELSYRKSIDTKEPQEKKKDDREDR